MTRIMVLGAGMVGVSAALELQSRGHDVTLIDRRAPGRETSFGNAGLIQTEAAEPYALPRDPASLLRIALGRDNQATWTLRGVMQMAPALFAYYRNSAPRRHARLSAVFSQLTCRATDDHAGLIDAAGAGNLIAKNGYYEAHRDPAQLDAAAAGLDRLRRTYGLEARVVDGAALCAEEPALRRTLAGAIHWPQSWSCADPGGLTAAYAELFEQRGGDIASGDAMTLCRQGAGWTVTTDDGPLGAQQAVVALGPWSPDLLRPFGYRVRMILKRGYHGHFAAPQSLRRPFLDTLNGVLAVSMRAGLRVTTGAAIVPPGAPPDPVQLTVGVQRLSDLMDLGQRIGEPQWFGTRPCTPDMLPVIGAAPRHKGLWFAFGHGHHGFTLGPTTARILADTMEGRDSPLARALSPARL